MTNAISPTAFPPPYPLPNMQRLTFAGTHLIVMFIEALCCYAAFRIASPKPPIRPYLQCASLWVFFYLLSEPLLLGLASLDSSSRGYGALAAFSGCALSSIGIFALCVSNGTYRITSRSQPFRARGPGGWDRSAKVRRLSILFTLVAYVLVFGAQFLPPKSCAFCTEGGVPPGVKMGLAFYGVGRLTLCGVFIRLCLLRLLCPTARQDGEKKCGCCGGDGGGGGDDVKSTQARPTRTCATEAPYVAAAFGSVLFIAQMSPVMADEFYGMGWLMIPAVSWAVLRINKEYEGLGAKKSVERIEEGGAGVENALIMKNKAVV